MRAFQFPSPLYSIVDTLGDPKLSPVALADAVLAAGIRLLQLRMKDVPTRDFVAVARAVQARAAAHGAALIVNDRADVALLVGAAGLHLGQDDLPATDARRLLGADKIIGLSTHNVEQARQAVREGAVDYIGFGPVYATTSKRNPDPVQGLEGLTAVRRLVGLPIVAIGGITLDTAPATIAAGADAVAVIGDIIRAADVRSRVEEYLSRLSGVGR